MTRRAGLRLRATAGFYPARGAEPPLEDHHDELVLGPELERGAAHRVDRGDPVGTVGERGHGHRLRIHADARDEGTTAGDTVELDLERVLRTSHLDRGSGAIETGAEQPRVARVGLGHVLD